MIANEIAAGTLEVNDEYIGNDPIVLPEGYVLKGSASEKVYM